MHARLEDRKLEERPLPLDRGIGRRRRVRRDGAEDADTEVDRNHGDRRRDQRHRNPPLVTDRYKHPLEGEGDECGERQAGDREQTLGDARRAKAGGHIPQSVIAGQVRSQREERWDQGGQPEADRETPRPSPGREDEADETRGGESPSR